MDEKRRQFIAGMAAIAGAAALDGFGLFKALPSVQSAEKISTSKPSRNIKDYPHITEVIPSRDIKLYFPIIVDACSDPKTDYLSKVPFLIELESAKIWSESRFEWDAISVAGAGGLQQLMETTACDFGLTVAKSPQIQQLNTAMSEHRKLRSTMISRRQELHNLAESGSSKLTQSTLNRMNKLRAELADLHTKRSTAYQNLKAARKRYVEKIHSLSPKQREKFDGRFVPELVVPAGIKHIVRDIMECKDFFGGSVDMNVWRGIAAYNSGLERTKKWDGLPFIEETVHYTRGVLSNLTRSLELKYAFATGDANLIAKTRMRIGSVKAYSEYVVKSGDNFYEIVREQIMDRYKLSYSKALGCIRDGQGNKIDPKKISIILPKQRFRIYPPK